MAFVRQSNTGLSTRGALATSFLEDFAPGDDVTLDRVIEIPAGLTGSDVFFTVKVNPTDADPGVLQKEISSTAFVTNANGIIAVSIGLVPADTLALAGPGYLTYDLQVITSDGANYTVEAGYIRATRPLIDAVTGVRINQWRIKATTLESPVQGRRAFRNQIIDDFTAGDDFAVTGSVYNVPTGRTIASAAFTIRASPWDVDGSAIYQVAAVVGNNGSTGVGSVTATLSRTQTALLYPAARGWDMRITLDNGKKYTVGAGSILGRASVTTTSAPSDPNITLYSLIGPANIYGDYDASITARARTEVITGTTYLRALEDRRCTKTGGFIWQGFDGRHLPTVANLGTRLNGQTQATFLWEVVQYSLDDANSLLTDPNSGSRFNLYHFDDLNNAIANLHLTINGTQGFVLSVPWNDGDRVQFAIVFDLGNATVANRAKLLYRIYDWSAGAWPGSFTSLGDSTGASGTFGSGGFQDTASHGLYVGNSNGLLGGFRAWVGAGMNLSAANLVAELPNSTAFATAPIADFRFDGNLTNVGSDATLTMTMTATPVYVSDETVGVAGPLVSLGYAISGGSVTYQSPTWDLANKRAVFTYTSTTSFAAMFGPRDQRQTGQAALATLSALAGNPTDTTNARYAYAYIRARSSGTFFLPALWTLTSKYHQGGYTSTSTFDLAGATAVSSSRVQAFGQDLNAGTTAGTADAALMAEATAAASLTYTRTTANLMVALGVPFFNFAKGSTPPAATTVLAMDFRRLLTYTGSLTSAIKTQAGTTFVASHGAVLASPPIATTVTITPAGYGPVPGLTYPYVVNVLDQNGVAMVGQAVTVVSGTPATGTITASGTTDGSGNVALTYTPLTTTGSTVITATAGAATGTLTITNAATMTNSFTGANASNVLGVPCSDGVVFTQAPSGSGVMGVNTNQLALITANTSPPFAVARRQVTASDGTHSLKWAVIISTVHSYYQSRMDSGYANGLQMGAEIGASRWSLYKIVAGAATLLGTWGTAPASGDVAQVVLAGTSVIVKINGTARITVTESTGVGNTYAAVLTGDANTGQRWDDWSFTP